MHEQIDEEHYSDRRHREELQADHHSQTSAYGVNFSIFASTFLRTLDDPLATLLASSSSTLQSHRP
jgi:hypothetical protein